MENKNCGLCGAPLSTYNKTGQCFSHFVDEEEKEAATIIAATRKEKPVKLSTKKKVRGADEEIKKLEIRSGRVLEDVSESMGIALDLILGSSRKARIVEARHIAMYLMRKKLQLTFPQIAEKFNRKDHTTAIHACKKIEELVSRGKLIIADLKAPH